MNLTNSRQDAAHLASVARDICPFPNYNPNPLFINMLSINSSLHLKNHYTAVQSSLTPKQLEDFTQGLRTTFGREGKVTLGGVGVVALSLAGLFDTLARQVRGEWVSDSGPIPGLFLKDLRGYYPPHVYTISEYLRLVPHIANNPTRMREESERVESGYYPPHVYTISEYLRLVPHIANNPTRTREESKRYLKQLINDGQSLDKLGENHMLPKMEDITAVNVKLGLFFAVTLNIHLHGIKATVDRFGNAGRRPLDDIIFNLNCDPEADSRTLEAFDRYRSNSVPKTWLEHAQLQLGNFSFHLACVVGTSFDLRIARSEDFDLKANALGKWAE